MIEISAVFIIDGWEIISVLEEKYNNIFNTYHIGIYVSLRWAHLVKIIYMKITAIFKNMLRFTSD